MTQLNYSFIWSYIYLVVMHGFLILQSLDRLIPPHCKYLFFLFTETMIRINSWDYIYLLDFFSQILFHNSEYEHLRYKQISSVTLHSVNTYIQYSLHFAGFVITVQNINSSYRQSFLFHLSMQVTWIYGKSVVMKQSQYELGFENHI